MLPRVWTSVQFHWEKPGIAVASLTPAMTEMKKSLSVSAFCFTKDNFKLLGFSYELCAHSACTLEEIKRTPVFHIFIYKVLYNIDLNIVVLGAVLWNLLIYMKHKT